LNVFTEGNKFLTHENPRALFEDLINQCDVKNAMLALEADLIKHPENH